MNCLEGISLSARLADIENANIPIIMVIENKDGMQTA
jgi:hypothetical protein